MSADERLAAVLAEHVDIEGFVDFELYRNYAACACGWWSTTDQEAGHRAHVATALREAGYVHRDEVTGARTAVDAVLIELEDWGQALVRADGAMNIPGHHTMVQTGPVGRDIGAYVTRIRTALAGCGGSDE